jgi:outer membrane protein assembly factor BamD
VRLSFRPVVITIFNLALLFVFGCAEHPDVTTMEPEPAFHYLQRAYAEGRYLEAIDGLDFFTLNYSGSTLVDSAQFLLGEAHFKQDEFLLAADAYGELVRRFPKSALVGEAMYQQGVSYWKLSPDFSLDQEYTQKAIDALQAFIDYFPERTERVKDTQHLIEVCRDKLAHKQYDSGRIYLVMKDYKAAALYFQQVMDKYYDSQWAACAAFQIGATLKGQDKPTEAADAFRAYITKYPTHEWVKKAELEVQKLEARQAGK